MRTIPLWPLILSLALSSAAGAAATAEQKCEADVELASAKYAQCRLTAESKYSKLLDAAKRDAALSKCSAKLTTAFSKASTKYGVSCAATEPPAAFHAYLTQCSDDAAAAAAGAALPDCAGDLASCTADLATAEGDLATCQGELAACEALPPVRLLKTGQTTSYGAGTDGDLQLGVAHGFVDNGDGTITDTKTGLMWEKKSDDGTINDKDNTYIWGMTSAPYTMNGTVVTTFLATLNSGGGFAGHTDWRLPNLTELESIRNLGTSSPATFPAFDTACTPACTVLTCSCTGVSLSYRSSSSFAASPDGAWVASFFSGSAAVTAKSTVGYARAVRNGS